MTKNPVQSGNNHVINTSTVSYYNVSSPNSSPNGSATKNESEQVGNTPVNVVPPLYATKLRPTSSTMANLQKLEANVPNDADYHVWLPLDSVHEVNVRMKNLLYGYFIGKRLAFLVLECDNLVMSMPNLKGTGYTKETIRVEYEWKPSLCSTCLIFGYSLDICPKASKRVVNKMDKGKGGSSGADDEGFVEVKKKKLGAKQSTQGANQKTTPSVGKKNVSTSGNVTFFLSNSFEALNVENSISEEVEMGNKASTSGVQEEGQSSTPLVKKINMFEKQLLEGNCVLVDDDGKPLKRLII
ncbi:zinc finger, CCHC-type containing protein [Tanacetum coccineum]